MPNKASEKSKQKRRAKKAAARKVKAKSSGPSLTLVENQRSDLPELPDPRGMAEVFGGFFNHRGDGPDDEAQSIMYDAFEEESPKKRIALARKALKVSPNCADAYCLLAEEAAGSLEETISLFRKGVAGGERALGPQTFKDDVGHFWGIFETRPYMRARSGLAQSLWAAGESSEAFEHYRDLLRLNQNDNQGIRYLLLTRLIESNRDEEAAALLSQSAEDVAATWVYSAALLAFRQQGDAEASRQALALALATNPHVPSFLLGDKNVPRWSPAYTGFGDESEAVAYVADALVSWEQTPNALTWLRAHTVKSVEVTVAEAKKHLSKLIERALDGEEVVIARKGTPLVKLAPVLDTLIEDPADVEEELIELASHMEALLEDYRFDPGG